MEVRESGRVIVVDEVARVLLLELDGPDAYDTVWLTPGGSLEAGESSRTAASRELAEETGLRVPPRELRGPVAVTAGRFRLHGRLRSARDEFYFHRCR